MTDLPLELVSPPPPLIPGGDTVPNDDIWESWGIAARWTPQHGWHQPDE